MVVTPLLATAGFQVAKGGESSALGAKDRRSSAAGAAGRGAPRRDGALSSALRNGDGGGGGARPASQRASADLTAGAGAVPDAVLLGRSPVGCTPPISSSPHSLSLSAPDSRLRAGSDPSSLRRSSLRPPRPQWGSRTSELASASTSSLADAGVEGGPGGSPADYGVEGARLAAEAQAAARQQREVQMAEEVRAELAAASARAPILGASAAVARAYVFARSVHEGQRVLTAGGRFVAPDGGSVNVKCLAVAEILARMGLDEETVAAGMLHAALDHSMTTPHDLQTSVGEGEALLAERISRAVRVSEQELPPLDDHAAVSETLENMREMLLGLDDARATLAALAVRLHELRSLDDWGVSEADQQVLAHETLALLTPLADRIGVWGLKAEMEDLCFRVTQPLAYEHLSRDVGRVTETQRAGVGDEVERLAAELDARGIRYEGISGRRKGLYSIWRKMQTKSKRVDQVLDKRGVRVIVSSEADCYRAMEAIKAIYRPIARPRKKAPPPGTSAEDVGYRIKDYIKSPKENGYQSLHATVAMMPGGETLEVQVRSAEMHFAAEWGVAAHWRYKEAAHATRKPAVAAPGFTSLDRKVACARFTLSAYTDLSGSAARPGSSPGVASSGSLAGSLLESNAARAFVSAEASQSVGEAVEPVMILERRRGAAVAVRKLPPGATAADLLASSPSMRGQLIVNASPVEEGELAMDAPLSTGDVVEWTAPRDEEGAGGDYLACQQGNDLDQLLLRARLSGRRCAAVERS
uniref:RelA/SpoT domain-containing protein n=1 Tax=Prasinoderma singulare TaxID=676789 RepID=A0A7S3F8I2_9VIRI|mmetsp:Transcript_15513/g.48234  ORF Transcript_15513/g.48234 Transcript_15513/m.48234 type:complete len:756 (+) Transcript_15513:532-2799(+)